MADIAEARLVPDEAELKASLKAAKGKIGLTDGAIAPANFRR